MATANMTRQQYWRKQLQRTVILLAVWFIVAFAMSIFGVEALNGINFGGIPFGFWMAQQGSIFVFVSLILIYAVASGRLDREAGLEETDETTSDAGASH